MRCGEQCVAVMAAPSVCHQFATSMAGSSPMGGDSQTYGSPLTGSSVTTNKVLNGMESLSLVLNWM